MCGFVGVFNHRPLSETTEQEELIKQMNRLIVHRGPDDEGYFHDEHVGFGFRRLSIIDVEHGKQPLSYEDEKYWIIFNGEIYNYVELKEELVKKAIRSAQILIRKSFLPHIATIKKKRHRSFAGCLHF